MRLIDEIGELAREMSGAAYEEKLAVLADIEKPMLELRRYLAEACVRCGERLPLTPDGGLLLVKWPIAGRLVDAILCAPCWRESRGV